MNSHNLAFDHIHLLSQSPRETAQWYVDHLDGEITRVVETRGAQQVCVSFGGFVVLVRGSRGTEAPSGKSGIEWGLDHFGVRVGGDFDALCARLRDNGVKFAQMPTQINPTTRIAFIDAPEGVTVELVSRSDA